MDLTLVDHSNQEFHCHLLEAFHEGEETIDRSLCRLQLLFFPKLFSKYTEGCIAIA